MLEIITRNRLKRIMESVVPRFILGPILTRRMKRKYRVYAGRSAEEVFTDIHDNNRWRGRQSVSGQGSDIDQTRTIRALLPQLIHELKIGEILDVPCGDFNWMQHVDLGTCQYIGGDIVASLAAKCQQMYGSPTRRFMHLDITRDDLPRTDLILCRDCFIHLPIELIQSAVRNFKRSGAKFLFTTNGPTRKVNPDIVAGGYRLPNLCLAPFNFPKPIRSMHDDAPSEHLANNPDFDRYMELWELEKIPG